MLGLVFTFAHMSLNGHAEKVLAKLTHLAPMQATQRQEHAIPVNPRHFPNTHRLERPFQGAKLCIYNWHHQTHVFNYWLETKL